MDGWTKTSESRDPSRIPGVHSSAFAEACWTNGTHYVCVYTDELRDEQGRPYAVGWIVHYEGDTVHEVVDVDSPTEARSMAKQMMQQISGVVQSQPGSPFGTFGSDDDFLL